MNKPANKQIEVQIMGQSYLLACPVGGESALLDAVERVDTAMCRIRDTGKVKARDRIAVLTSLNLAFELSQKEATSSPAAAPVPNRGTSPNTPDTPETPASAQDQTRLDHLVRRIDQALGGNDPLP
ncbi:MAG: cell division protein ZapA [Hydrogenophaga sp.]|uniref:cell division protein ZapA n=1 Tax=Hydrogenophaga sp. TaxID=1904254 RepID=UPI00271B05BD|nr:cell division protein ZapA [Hydrogenophaga sp.]MDO9480078.1 cell division protein ZapA [Hydrogenophaga sp.]MDP2162914.1 cell division protein ZapA [Hydrogenophaga sp.]MDP3347034.1 cell division protein ZapA [Hydrogenophaga sp.]MDP3806256.1 cell division protein ZapA [Hydrogenophaga sp.]MDZ4127864.1 cell division protein ZapA [Hydrogenophaga sp.]